MKPEPAPDASPRAILGVRVRYVAAAFGSGFLHHERNNPRDVFPRGHLTRIFNFTARRMANATVEDGKERRRGAWEVTPVFHGPGDRATPSGSKNLPKTL